MIRQFEKPDEDIIFNDAELPKLLRLSGAREDLIEASIKGHVDGDGSNVLSAGSSFTEGETSITSREYVELAGPRHAYKAYHNGRVQPVKNGPPARKNPYVGAYLQANRWPYSSGPSVSVSSVQTESQSAQTVPHHTATGEVEIGLRPESIRSNEALKIFGAASGSGTVSVEIRTGGQENSVTWALSSTSVSGAGWSPWAVTLDPAERVGYQTSNLRVWIDASGISQIARPVAFREEAGLGGGAVPVPDGTAFVHVTEGHGTDNAGRALGLSSPVTFRASLSGGQLSVYATKMASGSKERAIYAGRDRTQSHLIERSYSTRVWARPTPPQSGRALLFRNAS